MPHPVEGTNKVTMVKSYMLPQLWFLAGPTSPDWRQCSGSLVIVLLYHAPHPGTHPTTSYGGSILSPTPHPQGQSLALAKYLTLAHSWMQAPQLASASSSVVGGEHGGSSQIGKVNQENETLAGQRLLASSSSSAVPSLRLHNPVHLRHLETMEELLRADGKAVVGTGPLTSSSDAYFSSSMNPTAPSSLDTSPAPPTLQMAPQGASSHPTANFSHLF